MELLTLHARRGLHRLGRPARRAAPRQRREPRPARRDHRRAPTTSTSRCWSCRCATTASTIGVITLSKLGLDGFGPDDLRLLTILADQAATAVGSARLLTRTQDLAGELRRLLDMSAELSGSLDPRQVAELMAGHLARAMGVDECVISYWDRAAGRVESLGYYPVHRIERDRAVLRGLGLSRRRCASSSAR